MAQDIRTLTEGIGEKEGTRRGFRPFASLAEGIRNSRARRAAIGLFATAMRFGERESIDEAMAAYTALPRPQKEKALLSLQRSLKSCSYLPFESEEKTLRLVVIAELFEKAAILLPVGSDGERITAPYQDAVRMLRDVVEHDDLRESGKSEHADALLACVRALWELEYGNFKFWEARASDPATRAYAITKLLEMPGEEGAEEHGWSLLRKDLGSLGRHIAATGSPRAVPFFRSMLMDGDKGVVRAAFAGAAYLEPIPQEFMDMAGEASKVAGLEKPANDFIDVMLLKQLMAGVGEDRHKGIRFLAGLYSKDVRYLGPMLEAAGQKVAESALADSAGDKEKAKAADTLAALAVSGIRPCDAGTMRRLLGQLSSSRGAIGSFYNITGAVMTGVEDDSLRALASQSESDRVNSCLADLEHADSRQFDAASELVRLLATGRDYLLKSGIIAHVMNEMVEVAYEPTGLDEAEKREQRRRAVGVIRELGFLGISVTLRGSGQDGSFTPEELARGRRLQEIFDEFAAEAKGAGAGAQSG